MDENAATEKKNDQTANLVRFTLIGFFLDKHFAEFLSVVTVGFETLKFLSLLLKLSDFPSNFFKFGAHTGLRSPRDSVGS